MEQPLLIPANNVGGGQMAGVSPGPRASYAKGFNIYAEA